MTEADYDYDGAGLPLCEPIDCRMCGTVGDPHVCPYADNEPLHPKLESELLALLHAEPLNTWRAPHSFGTDEYKLGLWSVGVFHDGDEAEAWDYVEYAVSPNGIRYEAWPEPGVRGLPASIANWSPEWPRRGLMVSLLAELAKLLRDR